MLGGDHLREGGRFGGVLFVAATAQVGYVGKFGHMRGRVVRMLCQRAVASFAGYVGVFAGGTCGRLIVVAHHACVLSGKGDWVLTNQLERAGPVMAVLPEGLGDDGAPYEQENRENGKQNQSRSNQMG